MNKDMNTDVDNSYAEQYFPDRQYNCFKPHATNEA